MPQQRLHRQRGNPGSKLSNRGGSAKRIDFPLQ
jgi:hypothetical protein